MKCPDCDEPTPTRVIDSRQKGPRKWRRRACPEGHRFTTWEIPETELVTEKTIEQLVAAAVARVLPGIIKEISDEIMKEMA